MKKTIAAALIGIIIFWAFPALANGFCSDIWNVGFNNFQLRQGDAVLPNYSGSDQYYRIQFAPLTINGDSITDEDLNDCLDYIKIVFSDPNSDWTENLSYGLYPDTAIGDIREVGYLLRAEIYLDGYNSYWGVWEYNENGFTDVSLVVSIDKTIVDNIAGNYINGGGINLDFEFYFVDSSIIEVPGISNFSNLGYDLLVPDPDDVKVDYHADESLTVNWTPITGNWFADDGAHMKIAAVSINEVNQMELTRMYHHNFVATWGSPIPLHMSNYFIWNNIKDIMETIGDGDFILYFSTESNLGSQRAQIFSTKSYNWGKKKKDKNK